MNQLQAPKAGVHWPDYRRSVAIKHVKRGYTYLCRHALTLLLLPLAASLLLELEDLYRSGQIARLWAVASQTDLTFNLVTIIACCSALVAALITYYLLQSRPVYLLDFCVHRPDESWTFSREDAVKLAEASQRFTPESIEFQSRVLWHSGLGQQTYLPPWLGKVPQQTSMLNARQEFMDVCITAVEDLLNKTGVTPRQIGVVIVNCSLFSPTPSLSATIMNHFKMSSKTINYNLAGMGCSAGIIAVDMARQMLQLYPNTYALVVSTENITQNMYAGTQRSMLIPNVIFRVGGAASLLTNKRSEAWRSKYTLQHVVRTHLGANDAAYNCVMEMEDADGRRGVKLSKELMAIAGESLKANITTLGPLVLPLSEQLLFAVNFIGRKLLGIKSLKPYIPDFQTAFQHICIHTGGRGVIDEIEKQLSLSKYMVEPSRAGLYRWGNVSSSSIWYVLSFIEEHRGLRKGDKVWQLGFGSGFKCNSAVWKANRHFTDPHPAWSGFDVKAMYEDLSAMERKLTATLAAATRHSSSGVPPSPPPSEAQRPSSGGSHTKMHRLVQAEQHRLSSAPHDGVPAAAR